MLTSEKRFLSSRHKWNPQPSDDQRDALTIELLRLRWQAEVQVPHASMCCLSGSHDMLITIMSQMASHRSSTGSEFDPPLGLRNRFSEVRSWRTFIDHLSFNITEWCWMTFCSHLARFGTWWNFSQQHSTAFNFISSASHVRPKPFNYPTSLTIIVRCRMKPCSHLAWLGTR